MVIYRGTDGKPGYHQTDDIHDAVTFVEQLRNDNGVEHARIFRLEEVNFEYRPYFRVELKAGEPALAAAPATPAVGAAAPADPPASAPADPPASAAPSTSTPPASSTSTAAADSAAVTAADSATDAVAGAASSAASTATSAATETASSVVDKVADARPAEADTGVDKTDSDNGVGARRGLFGR